MPPLRQTFLPLLEASLEDISWNDLQVLRRIMHFTIFGLDSTPFWRHSRLGEKRKVAQDHIGGIERQANHAWP